MRQSARMTGSKNSDHRASQAKAAFGRSFCLAVPELTRSTGIQLNARLSLRRPCELLTLSQSCGLADAASSGHAYRAIRGRCCVIEGSGPAQSCRAESSMTRRRSLILAIVTAGCWIILLAIVLNSVFAASTLTKQIRSKDRQSTQGR